MGDAGVRVSWGRSNAFRDFNPSAEAVKAGGETGKGQGLTFSDCLPP